jgi:protease I
MQALVESLVRSKKKLRGKRVAMLAGDGFEWVELIVPRRALRTAGAEVDVLSLHGGRIRGINLTVPTRTVRVDLTVAEADPESYDALFLVGGFVGPDFVRQSREARDFVRAFDVAEKPIAALCHGPWVLVSAELCAGRALASWPSLRDDIVHAGGVWRDEPVVFDRNWVSSRSPLDFAEFVPAVIEHFADGAATQTSPPTVSSPQPDEPLQAALHAARHLRGGRIRTLAAAALGTAAGYYVARGALPRRAFASLFA